MILRNLVSLFGIAVVAVARELVGFLWAGMHNLDYKLPASLQEAA